MDGGGGGGRDKLQRFRCGCHNLGGATGKVPTYCKEQGLLGLGSPLPLVLLGAV
jgi:hypothetical protein